MSYKIQVDKIKGKTISQLIKLCFSLSVLLLISACSGGGSAENSSVKAKKPWVMELQVIPSRLTINPEKFYAKPFTVRAKYSNAVVKNISKTVQWVSEDSNLLSVNEVGELVVTGRCDKIKCPVFLVGTDPDSGKSVRVTVHVKQHPKQKAENKTTPESTVASEQHKEKTANQFEDETKKKAPVYPLNLS